MDKGLIDSIRKPILKDIELDTSELDTSGTNHVGGDEMFLKDIRALPSMKMEDVTSYIYDGQGNKIGERTYRPNRKAVTRNALRKQILKELKERKKDV